MKELSYHLFKKGFRRLISLILILTVCLALLVFYARKIEPNILLTSNEKIVISNLPREFKGFRIVQISDLHGKTSLSDRLVVKVNELNPDVLVITGDVLDDTHRDYRYIIQVLGPMQAKYGKFFVSGNNEYRRELNWSKMEEAYQEAGVKVLHNQNYKLSYRGKYIWLIGVDDPNTNRARLDTAMTGTDKLSKILLAHSPEIIDQARIKKIDLVLVGHTHGGQVRIPWLTQNPKVTLKVEKFLNNAEKVLALGAGFINQEEKIQSEILSASEILNSNIKPGFENYIAGLYQSGKTQMYVNRGIGETRIPYRLFATPEITVIELTGITKE